MYNRIAYYIFQNSDASVPGVEGPVDVNLIFIPKV